MNAMNGLDGKSVIIGGTLVVGAIVVTHGGLLPIFLVGGIVYMIGTKKGWWGQAPHFGGPRSDLMRQRPAGGPPFFNEWHRQAHAADAAGSAAPSGQPSGQPGSQPGGYAPEAPVWTPPAAPQAPFGQPMPATPDAASAAAAAAPNGEVRVPIITAPETPAAPVDAPPVAPLPAAPESEYRRTVGESGSTLT